MAQAPSMPAPMSMNLDTSMPTSYQTHGAPLSAVNSNAGPSPVSPSSHHSGISLPGIATLLAADAKASRDSPAGSGPGRITPPTSTTLPSPATSQGAFSNASVQNASAIGTQTTGLNGINQLPRYSPRRAPNVPDHGAQSYQQQYQLQQSHQHQHQHQTQYHFQQQQLSHGLHQTSVTPPLVSPSRTMANSPTETTSHPQPRKSSASSWSSASSPGTPAETSGSWTQSTTSSTGATPQVPIQVLYTSTAYPPTHHQHTNSIPQSMLHAQSQTYSPMHSNSGSSTNIKGLQQGQEYAGVQAAGPAGQPSQPSQHQTQYMPNYVQSNGPGYPPPYVQQSQIVQMSPQQMVMPLYGQMHPQIRQEQIPIARTPNYGSRMHPGVMPMGPDMFSSSAQSAQAYAAWRKPSLALASQQSFNQEIKRRTKTGCLTCRRRRIKCDEQHPTCRNCRKSERICLGYDPVFAPQMVNQLRTIQTRRQKFRAEQPAARARAMARINDPKLMGLIDLRLKTEGPSSVPGHIYSWDELARVFRDNLAGPLDRLFGVSRFFGIAHSVLQQIPQGSQASRACKVAGELEAMRQLVALFFPKVEGMEELNLTLCNLEKLRETDDYCLLRGVVESLMMREGRLISGTRIEPSLNRKFTVLNSILYPGKIDIRSPVRAEILDELLKCDVGSELSADAAWPLINAIGAGESLNASQFSAVFELVSSRPVSSTRIEVVLLLALASSTHGGEVDRVRDLLMSIDTGTDPINQALIELGLDH